MKNLFTLAFFLLLFSGNSLSQQAEWQKFPIENGWKGIKLLETNKISVNDILGFPKIDDNEYYKYETDEAFVEVNYSTEPCRNNQYERGRFSIPKDNVLDYIVYLKKKVELSKIKFNRDKYKIDKGGDVENLAFYRDEEDGITMEVGTQNKIEYVTSFYFQPSPKISEKFRCGN